MRNSLNYFRSKLRGNFFSKDETLKRLNEEGQLNRKIKIIIVEDEVLTSMFLEMDLKKSGYDIQKIFSSGEDIIAYLTQDNIPDIILMDIHLSGKINGIETAEIIKFKFNVPVIFMTGYPDDHTKESAEKLKPLAYLIKPINNSEISSIVGINFN
jgi:CheY-like chemotaxis protein